MLRRSWSVLLGFAFVATGCSAVEEPRGEQPERSRLTVAVSGLPVSATARVEVVGHGQRREVPASRTLEVAPGSYEVRIGRVHSRSLHRTYLPADRVISVRVRAGRPVSVHARYRIAVSDRARIADPDPARNPVREVTATRVVLADGSYAKGLRRGQVIVSGATARVRRPFAALVREVTRDEQGRPVAEVLQVPMLFAMPKMVIRSPRPVEFDGDVLRAAATEGAGVQTGQSAGPEVAADWPALPLGNVCSQGDPEAKFALRNFGVSLTTEVDLEWNQPDVDVDFDELLDLKELKNPVKWLKRSIDVDNLHPVAHLAATVGVEGDVGFALEQTGPLKCGGDIPRPNPETVCNMLLARQKVKHCDIGNFTDACRGKLEVVTAGAVDLKCDLGIQGQIEVEATAVAKGSVGLLAKLEQKVSGGVDIGGDDDDGVGSLKLEAKPDADVDSWSTLETYAQKKKSDKLAATVRSGLLQDVGFTLGWQGAEIEVGHKVYTPLRLTVSGDVPKNKAKLEAGLDHELTGYIAFPGDFGSLDPKLEFKPVNFTVKEWAMRTSQQERPPPATRIPSKLRLPDESGRSYDPDRYETVCGDWLTKNGLAYDSESDRREPNDWVRDVPGPANANRTDFRTVEWAGCTGKFWKGRQLALYKGERDAEQAMAALRTGIENGAASDPDAPKWRTRVEPVKGVGDEAFAAGLVADSTGSSPSHAEEDFVIARLANAVVLVGRTQWRYLPEPGPPPPWHWKPNAGHRKVAKAIVYSLCDREWPC